MFKLLKPNDLVLLDRKYPSFWLFRCILEQGGDFCARMAIDKWSVLVGDFLKTGLKEQIIELKPGWEARKKCQKYGLPVTPFKLRLIRIVLDTGEIEVLATSLLDTELYPYELFKDLYHKRWPVEEHYELFKSRIEIANFIPHGRDRSAQAGFPCARVYGQFNPAGRHFLCMRKSPKNTKMRSSTIKSTGHDPEASGKNENFGYSAFL